jgi:anhydro-N-acetylmuramic acid kinase
MTPPGLPSPRAHALNLRVLGIMSGTSLDSVDFALCRTGHESISLEKHWQVRFPKALQLRLHAAAQGTASSWELAQVHHDLGRFYARHARRGLAGIRPALVGLHGQTVFHNPERQAPATLQVGEPAYLAETLRVPVVSNFRAGDMAAGGEGAPLATAFHCAVFAQRGRHVCVNNLGGISNVTSIDWRRGRQPQVLAFDTGPANVLMDLAMRHCTGDRQSMDKHGAWAARGDTAEALLARWLRHAYFRRPPPKSTGREVFGEPFLQGALAEMRRARLSAFDLLATLTALTARSLALNYRLHLPSVPDRVLLTGGGAANPVLVGSIRVELQMLRPSMEVTTSDTCGWPLQSIEPAAFAWLAYLRATRRPGNLPKTTGARRRILLGQVTEP